MRGYPTCPRCGARLLNDHHRNLYCPLCPEPDPECEARTLWADEQRYKHAIAKKKGGSRKAGRRRSTQQRRWRRDYHFVWE